MDYNKRLSVLSAELDKRRLDSFFVTSDVNVSYLSGFTGHDSMLLVLRKKRYFITDSRYVEEASRTVDGFDIALVKTSIYDTVESIVRRERLKRVGFEMMDMPYGAAHKLKEILATSHLMGVKGLIKSMRAVKDADEIALMKKSAALLTDVFGKVEPRIRSGASEEAIARDVEIAFIRNGARTGFSPIIASGCNASKPHARPSCDRISANDMVMVDIGCCLNGYNSDMTRMVPLGRTKKKLREIYVVVRDAQMKAMDAIRAGANISDVDNAARKHITKKGYGKKFGHATGHGIGLEVHEDPTVSGAADGILKPGMIFTVEPAIYLPGVGGVRIEDMVLVTENGCEVLTAEKRLSLRGGWSKTV